MNKIGRTNSPKIANRYKQDILLIKWHNPKLSGAKIRQSLEKIYPESKHIPKKRAIEKVVQMNRAIWENATPSELDRPWSIGICEKYKIPPEIISILIECDKVSGIKFTIREAQWLARLKPAIFEMVKKAFPEESSKDLPLEYLSSIVYQYSHKEKLCELMNKELDTTELDKDIFYNTSDEFLGKVTLHRMEGKRNCTPNHYK